MSETSVNNSPKRFRSIRNCMLISGICVFAQLYIFQPMLTELCRYFSVDIATSSLSVSLSTVGMAAGLFVFAFIADIMPRERLMGISLVVSSVLTVATVLFDNFYVLLFLNFLKGMALSGVSAVALSYITEEVDKSKLGLAISLYLSGNTLGGMSGRVAGTLLSGWGGWRMALIGIGLVCMLLTIVFIWKIPRSRNFVKSYTNVHHKMNQMKMLLTNRVFLGMFFIAALAMGGFVSVYNYLPVLLESPLFRLPHHIVAMIFMMYTTGIAGSVLTGKLSDRFSPELLLRVSLFVMFLGVMLLLSGHLAAIVSGLGILTFAFFSAHTMASRIVSRSAVEARSCATSIYWLFYYMGSSVAGLLTGKVLVFFGWAMFVESLLVIVGVAFVLSIISFVNPRHIGARAGMRRIFAISVQKQHK